PTIKWSGREGQAACASARCGADKKAATPTLACKISRRDFPGTTRPIFSDVTLASQTNDVAPGEFYGRGLWNNAVTLSQGQRDEAEFPSEDGCRQSRHFSSSKQVWPRMSQMGLGRVHFRPLARSRAISAAPSEADIRSVCVMSTRPG